MGVWVPQLFVAASPWPVNSSTVLGFEMPAQPIDHVHYAWDANGLCGL